MLRLIDNRGGVCEECGVRSKPIYLEPRLNENLPMRRLCKDCRFPKGPSVKELVSAGHSEEDAKEIVADDEADRYTAENERNLDRILSEAEEGC